MLSAEVPSSGSASYGKQRYLIRSCNSSGCILWKCWQISA
nr:MAG TPA: hypothetical protein [Caudoviricetes sp.]